MELKKMTGNGYCGTCKKHIKIGNNVYSDGFANYTCVGCFEKKTMKNPIRQLQARLTGGESSNICPITGDNVFECDCHKHRGC